MEQSTGSIGAVFIDDRVDGCGRDAETRVEVYAGNALDRSVYACRMHVGEVERAARLDGGQPVAHPMTTAIDRPVCGSTFTYRAAGDLLAAFDAQGWGA